LLFLKKKIEVVLVFLALAGLAEPCIAQGNDPCVIENGRVTVFDSQSFSIGDEGKPVLERLGDYDSTDEDPGGVNYYYIEKGISVSIGFDGNINLVSLFYDYKNRDGSVFVSPLDEIVIEGIEVDRQTSMDEFISTLQDGAYDFEIVDGGGYNAVRIIFKNGYRCAFYFLKSKNYLFDEVQYYSTD